MAWLALIGVVVICVVVVATREKHGGGEGGRTADRVEHPDPLDPERKA